MSTQQQQGASSSGAATSTGPSNAPSASGGENGSDSKFRIPYTMTAAYGEARFAELYDKALTRKK
jgi:hypothetical protein